MGWNGHTHKHKHKQQAQLPLSLSTLASHAFGSSRPRRQKKKIGSRTLFLQSVQRQKKTNQFLRSRSGTSIISAQRGTRERDKKAHGVDGDSERGFVCLKKIVAIFGHACAMLSVVILIGWNGGEGEEESPMFACNHKKSHWATQHATKEGTLIALREKERREEGKKEIRKKKLCSLVFSPHKQTGRINELCA